MRIRSRYFQRTFDESVVLLLNNIERTLQKYFPIGYSLLFRCRPGQLTVIRMLLSVPFGLLFGYLMHNLIVLRAPSFTDDFEHVTRVLVVAMVTVGYVLSVQTRAIIWLIFPNILGGACMIILQLMLMHSVLKRSFKHLNENLRILRWINTCTYLYRYKVKFFHWNMRVRPIEEMFRNITGIDYSFKDEEVESNQKKMVDLDAAQSKLMGMEDHVLKKCFDIMENFRGDCETFLTDMLGSVLAWSIDPFGFWSLLVAKGCRCVVNKIEGFACGSSMNQLKSTITKSRNKLGDYQKLLKEQAAISASHIQGKCGKYNFNSVAEIQQEIKAEASQFSAVVGAYNELMMFVVMILLFVAFSKANKYHKKYLTELAFDNQYVDRYFRHIDKRRADAKKIHLLPLRATDLKELHYLFSPQVSFDQIKKKWGHFLLWFVVTFISGGLLYFNLFIADMIDIFYEELNFVAVDRVEHSWHPKFTGGLLAKQLGQVFHRSFNVTDSIEYDLGTCVEPSSRMHLHDYINLATLNVLIGFAIYFSAFLNRFKKIICDYFYPRYAKERTLKLYNTRLQTRKEFISNRKSQLNQIVKAHKVYNDEFEFRYTYGRKKFSRSVPFMVRYVFWFVALLTSKRCFVCNLPIRIPYVACDTEGCKLLYCDPCWDDCNQRCICCGQMQEYAPTLV